MPEVDLGIHRSKAVTAVVPYKSTAESIRTVCEKARAARHDADLRRWAGESFAKAGLDGRAKTGSVRERCDALAAGVVSQTTYVPDPTGSEWIQAPHITLCLRDTCIPVGDCDDLLLALVGAMLSVGMHPFVVHQWFAGGAQEHVLGAVRDELGQAIYVDVANTTVNVYTGSRAMREEWHDPMTFVGAAGTTGPEFVTLGSATGGRIMPSQINPQLAPVGLGLVSVADIDQIDAQVQGDITSLQDAAKSCTGLSQSQQDALTGFANAWAALHNQWQGLRSTLFESWVPQQAIIGAIALQFSTISNDMRGYLPKVAEWQGILKAACTNYTPPPGPVTPVPAPDTPTPAGDTAHAIAETAKVVGGLLVTGVIAYGVYKGIGILSGLVPAKRRA